jgi:hypothetical protein
MEDVFIDALIEAQKQVCRPTMAHTARWLENSARGHKELYHSTCRSQASQVKIGYIRTGFEGVDGLCRTHRIILHICWKGHFYSGTRGSESIFPIKSSGSKFRDKPIPCADKLQIIDIAVAISEESRTLSMCQRWKATAASGGDSVDVRDGLINFQARGLEVCFQNLRFCFRTAIPYTVFCKVLPCLQILFYVSHFDLLAFLRQAAKHMLQLWPRALFAN